MTTTFKALCALRHFDYDGEMSLVDAATPFLRALGGCEVGRKGGGANAAELAAHARDIFLAPDEPQPEGFERLLAARIETTMIPLVVAGFAYRVTTGTDELRWALTKVGWAVADAA